MLYLIALLLGVAVAGSVLLVSQLIPGEPGVVRRLAELSPAGAQARETMRRRRRQERTDQLQAILEQIGARVQGQSAIRSDLRTLLIQAGYTSPGAVAVYLGARIALGIGMAFLILILLPLARVPGRLAVFGAIWGLLMGWVLPTFIVGARARRRKKEVVKALPDALDLLVVCVEAGLGLNQALVRVAEEIGNVSPVLGEQLTLTNLEIRAGTAREDALRHLGERTGVEDVASLVSMMIQTDRFGTSIAQALRTHSDTLRTKRRQRAEEAAAKTAIKMLFPLVFLIFPALFVVILGPAVIQILEALSSAV
jgi:tight adherence protein C